MMIVNKTRNCSVSFCDNILDDFDDFCWGCYDRILENYNNKNTNPQWESYKLQEIEERENNAGTV